MTIFVSTAYLDEAERCNRVGLIHQGRLLACGTPDEVKRLMRGTILEIRTDEPRPRRRRALRGSGLPGRCRVGLFGDRVHVVIREPERTAAEAIGRLRAGRPERSLGIRASSRRLEDVFISVLAEKGRLKVSVQLRLATGARDARVEAMRRSPVGPHARRRRLATPFPRAGNQVPVA